MDDPLSRSLDETPVLNWLWWTSGKRVTSWYLGRCQWHEIRSLGSTSIVRLSAVAPVIGYLLLANELTLGLFESWKLYFFYFGTVAIAVGALIYSIRCPGEAKKYDTAVEYTVAEADFFTANPIIIVKAIHRSLIDLRHQRPDISRDILTIVAKIMACLSDSSREARKDATITLMDELWHIRIFIRQRSRIACRICYDIGILLVFSPSIVTMLQIVHVLPRL